MITNFIKMRIFTTVYDVMDTIRGNFCLGGRGFTTPVVDQVPNNGRITVWVLVGVPGTGKTTIAHQMMNAYPPFRCRAVSRDEARTDLLIEFESLNETERLLHIKSMDALVTRRVNERIRAMLDNPGRLCALIVDGCHTDYNVLSQVLNCLETYGSKVLIHLLMLGDPDSVCCHAVSPNQEGDYSDYGPHGTHQNVPLVVLERKRKEMADLLTNHMKEILMRVDEVYCIYDCFDRRKKVKYNK